MIEPAYSVEALTYRIGLWVKDGTQGIGTITYIDPTDGTFGALGHGITETKLKRLITLKSGEITKANITEITKGEKGNPGQIGGILEENQEYVMGDISCNTAIGIYGTLNKKGYKQLKQDTVPIAYQDEIVEGPAEILTNLDGNNPQKYQVMIQKVSRYSTEPSKGMVIKIVDPKLLAKTNGIIQGMSGSPLLQNGKLIGAVTHVFVNDPTRGYGIFIENMLETAEHIE